MTRTTRAYVIAGLLVGLCLVASAQKAQKGQKVLAPEDIKDCAYWQQRADDATQCAQRNQAHANNSKVTLTEGHCSVPGCRSKDVGKEVDSSTKGLYAAAANACKAAVPKYYAEKAKCERRQKQAAAMAGPNATAEQVEAINKLISAINAYAQNKTKQNITAIARALEQLERANYKGAGTGYEGDPLAGLGLEFNDISQLTNYDRLAERLDVGSWYGHSWEEVPNRSEFRDKESYCKEMRRVDTINCERRIERHCADYERNSASKRVCDKYCGPARFSGYASEACREQAEEAFRHCLRYDTVVEDSAGHLTLMDSTGGGFYQLPPRAPRCP